MAAIPFLAILVAILTAIDTWLKPAVKWQIYSEDQDKLDNLILSTKAPNDNDLLSKFSEIRDAHRKKIGQ